MQIFMQLIDMKKIFSLLVLMLAVTVGFAQTKDEDKGKAKDKEVKDVYVFGVSIAFTDTVAYFTEVQHVEGAVLVDDMLPNRHMYSYELKNYMSFNEDMQGRTSFIFFDDDKAKLVKKEAKIKKRLTERNGMTVRYLGDKFKFTKQ